MNYLFQYLSLLVGICIAVISGVNWYQSYSPLFLIVAGLGLFLILLAGLVLRFKRSNTSKIISWIAIVTSVGLTTVAWFLTGSIRWQIIVISVINIFFQVMAARLRIEAKSFILHAQDGSTLMEVKKLEFKGANLNIKGKMMGTMPTTAQMRPEEVWKALTLIPLSVILGFPAYLFRAWKSKGQPSKGDKSKTKLY